MNIKVTRLRHFMLMGLLTLLAACKSVEIVSPAKNEASNTAPEFRIKFKDGVPDTFTATLNGTALDSSLFSVAENEAFLQIDMGMLVPGDNVFAVTEPAEASVTFHLDQEGPVIHFLGAQGDDPKTVTGYLLDAGGAVSISVNGTDLPLDEQGNFSGSVSAANVYDAVATDVFGYTTTESYIKLGNSFNPAIGVRVNEQGLAESLPNAIIQIVESLNFNDFITNPVSESCSGAVIADACGNFNINDVDLTPGSTVSIQALSGNKIRVNIGLSRLDMDTTATTYARCKSFICGGSGTIFGTLNFSGVTTVRDTQIAADFIVTVQNGNVSVQIVDGSLDVDVPAFGLSVDIDFGAVEDVPFVGDLLNTVVNGIINGLVGVFGGIIVDIVDGFLASPISSLINNLIADILPDSIAIPVADTQLNLGFSPENFTTSAGGFDLVMANSLTIDAVDSSVLPPLGSFYVQGNAPSPYPSTTPAGQGVDLTATVSANLINQVLTEAYKGGLLNITLDENTGFTVGTLASIPDFPIDLVGVTEATLQLSGESAPVVEVLPQASAADGVVRVRLLGLNLKVNLNFGDGMQEVLNTTVDLVSPFDIGITADNKLTIGIETTPDVNVQDFAFRLNGVVLEGGSNSVITNLLNTLAPDLLPRVLDSIGGIPMPAIAGFSIQLADIWNPNADNNAYLSLGGNLVNVNASLAADAPVVSATAVEKGFAWFGSVSLDEQRTATISVEGDNPEAEPMEYRYRVNGGHWTVWKQRSEIRLNYLQGGDNLVEICGRTSMLQEDCTEVVVSVPFAQ